MSRYVQPGVATLCGALGLLALATPAVAQIGTTPPTRVPVATALPPAAYQPLRVGPITLAGSLRVRGEGWSWFEATGADAGYTYGNALLRVGATYANPRVDVMLEASQPTILGAPSNAVATGPAGQLGMGATYRVANGNTRAGLFLKQGFVRLKNVGAKGNMARLGRIEFVDGTEVAPTDSALAWVKRERIAHRVLANFAFSAAQRSYDALHVARSTPRYNLTVMAGMPTEGVFQLDGQGTLDDVRVAYGALTLPATSADVRLFAIRYEDRRNIAKVDNRPAAVRTTDLTDVAVNTLGAHLLWTRPVGTTKTDLLLWGTLQNGDWGAQSHRASAFAVEGGVQPALPLRPWLRVGYSQGSGDDTPGTTATGEHRTYFQMLPTPRLYARTPFYNMMNNRDLFTSLILRPLRATTVRAEAHRLSLTEGRDLWYAGGGAFNRTVFGYQGRPSGGRTNLATLLDLGIDRGFGPLTTVSGYVGTTLAGDVVRNVHPAADNGSFVYLELTRRF